MIRKLLIGILLLGSIAATKPATFDGEATLQKMYKRYAGKWYRTYTFNQTTEIYKNDSLKRSETWYEAALFPDKFRIDFINIDSGNAVIFKGDSTYNFRKGKLRSTRQGANDLNFLLGGMYFYSFADAVAKMKEYHYDLGKSFETNWKGKPVYVIGAGSENEKVNQLWIDQANLVVVRMIKYEANRKEEALFEDHIKLGGGWTETKVIFYIDDKLAQKELYHNCVANPVLDDRLFEPADFGKWHWYKN